MSSWAGKYACTDLAGMKCLLLILTFVGITAIAKSVHSISSSDVRFLLFYTFSFPLISDSLWFWHAKMVNNFDKMRCLSENIAPRKAESKREHRLRTYLCYKLNTSPATESSIYCMFFITLIYFAQFTLTWPFFYRNDRKGLYGFQIQIQ